MYFFSITVKKIKIINWGVCDCFVVCVCVCYAWREIPKKKSGWNLRERERDKGRPRWREEFFACLAVDREREIYIYIFPVLQLRLVDWKNNISHKRKCFFADEKKNCHPGPTKSLLNNSASKFGLGYYCTVLDLTLLHSTERYFRFKATHKTQHPQRQKQ